jgi:SAM-dependent methyltransferase
MSKLTQLVRSAKGMARKQLRVRVESDASPRYPAISVPGVPSIYADESPTDCARLRFPGAVATADPPKLRSSLCTRGQLESPAFRYWAAQMQESWRLHRKLWEYCFILQALYERDMLSAGRRGLGFAVGEEPLPSLMASLGCEVLATDLDAADTRAEVWAQTAQLAASLEGLNRRRLCNEDEFRRRVSFRPVDMNRIPADLRGFDFTWSSCSFEHCGSIGLGKRFIREQMNCLKPGGLAIHTTEFNLSSLEETVDTGTTVIFRRQDIEALIRDLQAEGHTVEKLQLDVGASVEDSFVDIPPYSSNVHLKLELFHKYVSTSVALIIRKSAGQAGCEAA